MNAVTVKQAKRDLDSLIDHVIADTEPVVICTDSGKQAVLLSADEFNSWEETLYLLSNPANAEHLRKSIHEAKSGNLLEKKLADL